MAEEYTEKPIRGGHVIDEAKPGTMDREIVEYLKKEFKYIKTSLRTLKRNQQEIQRQLKKQKVHNSPKFKQDLPRLTLPGSSVDECIHGEVVQQNLKIIVSTVDLTDGFIIDEMFENGSLNRFEKEEIEEMSKVHKTRKLVSILARNDKGKFKKFLQVISQEQFYPHLAKLLNESYEKKLRENEKRIACIRCFIIQQVSIKQIMDHLCENRLIDLPDVESLIEGDKGSEHKLWGKIFEKIFDPVWGQTCVTILKEALQDDYQNIAKKILCQQNLKCLCSSTTLSHNTGSVGDASDISTTSTVIPDSKPDTHEWVMRHTRPFVQSPTYILESKPTKRYIQTGLYYKNGEERETLPRKKHMKVYKSFYGLPDTHNKIERLRHLEAERMRTSENEHQGSDDNIFRTPTTVTHGFRLFQRNY